jgi:hypothetical protein
VLEETGLCCTILGNRDCGVCGNVVFIVTVWGTVSIMWTGTESVKGGTILLHNYREQIVWVVC